MINGPEPDAGPFGPPPLGPPTFDADTGQQSQPWPPGHLSQADRAVNLPPPTGSPWGSPIPPQGAVPTGPPASRERPWWGLGDVLLSLPFIAIMTVIASVAWAVVGALTGSFDLEGFASGDAADLPPSLFAASLVGQQLGQGAWPWIVSKWKGRGMRPDWGWSCEWRDLLIGPATGVAALVLAVAVGALIAIAVGSADEVSNTGFLDDAEGTVAYWVLIGGSGLRCATHRGAAVPRSDPASDREAGWRRRRRHRLDHRLHHSPLHLGVAE